MTFSRLSIPRVYLLLCFFLLTFAIAGVSFSLSFHDWQRVFQIAAGGLGILLLAALARERLEVVDNQTRVLGLGLIVLGVVSSLRAHQPIWAFTELALLVTCVCIAAAFAMARKVEGPEADHFLMLFVVFICAIKATQFLAFSVYAFSSGAAVIDTDLLLSGFSNKRFYGQFQTLALPLLVFPLLLKNTARSTRVWLFMLLSFWWLVAVSGGTRGTWLGMAAAGISMFILGRSGRRWLGWQIAAASVGITLFWLVFSVLADYLGIEIINFAGDRLNSSLSARETIWLQAWDMIRERPWLGFGPMHFADIPNPIAAHPHQAILQWLSEWGVPSALCLAWLALRGGCATIRLVRERAGSDDPVDLLRLCLCASLVGALTQGMVDGVIVMPYTQLWLALVVGWLMALHVWKAEPAQASTVLRWSWSVVSVLAIGLLVFVMIRDVPHLGQRNEQFSREYGGHFQPRFWVQGVIAEKKP